jgi:hypothetical protein
MKRLDVKYHEQNGKLVMARFGKLSDSNDRSFDIEFWQSQSDKARFESAWQLVEFAHTVKGGDPNELRLQRSAASLQRRIR